MDVNTASTFAAAFFVFAASPGPDNLTILSKTVNDSPSHGIAYGCGVVTSILGFVVLAALGFTALSSHIGDNMRFVRYAGAAYLIYMGVTMWRAPVVMQARSVRGNLTRLFATGFLLNVSNPKMPIFYLALLPGTLGVRPLSVVDAAVILGLIVVIEALVIGGHVLVALRAKSALSQPRRIRALNRGAGALMIGAGALVATR